MPDVEAQSIYDELNRRGVFTQDAEAQQIGHILRARGVVSDPTQGGLVTPAPARQARPAGNGDPYGDPGVTGEAMGAPVQMRSNVPASGPAPAAPIAGGPNAYSQARAAHDAYLKPRDPGFENQVQQYTLKYLQNGDGSAPAQWLSHAASLSPEQRLQAIPVNNDVSRAAILRAAWQQSGGGNGDKISAPSGTLDAQGQPTIDSQGQPLRPSAFQRTMKTVGNVIGTPGAMVKAAVQPLEAAAYRNAQADAQKRGGVANLGVSPTDMAYMQRVANLPFMERAKALQGDSMFALAQPDKAQQRENAFQNASRVGQLAQWGADTATGMAFDPVTYAAAGLGPAMKAVGLGGKAVTGANRALAGGFATMMAAPILEDPGKLTSDPVRSIGNLVMAGLAGRHALESPGAGAVRAFDKQGYVEVPTTGADGNFDQVHETLNALNKAKRPVGRIERTPDSIIYHAPDNIKAGQGRVSVAQSPLDAQARPNAARDAYTNAQPPAAGSDAKVADTLGWVKPGDNLFLPDGEQIKIVSNSDPALLKVRRGDGSVQSIPRQTIKAILDQPKAVPPRPDAAQAGTVAQPGAQAGPVEGPQNSGLAKVHAPDSEAAQGAQAFVPPRVDKPTTQANTQATPQADTPAVSQSVPVTPQAEGQTPQAAPQVGEAAKTAPELDQHLSDAEAQARQRLTARQKAAEQATPAPEPVKPADAPPAPAAVREAGTKSPAFRESPPSSTQQLAPEQIGVLEGMQYKKTGIVDSKNAVTDALKGTDVFDKDQAGTLTVWRDLDGKNWIVNGHHRLELANRADRFVTTGPDGTQTDVPRNLDVRVLDAKDGWTMEKARSRGALENIRDGKGTALDALEVTQGMGIKAQDFGRHGISQTSDIARNLSGLQGLDAQALARVQQGDVPEHVAAGIGSVKGLSPEAQRGAIDEAARTGLGTYAKAARLGEIYLDDQKAGLLASGDGQSDLFGGEFNSATSTRGIRVELEDGVRRKLSGERSNLLKPVDAQLRSGEAIDAQGRKADAMGLAESQKALGERLDLLFRQDAVKAETARLAGEVGNGKLTKAQAADQLAGIARQHVGRSVADLADPTRVQIDAGGVRGDSERGIGGQSEPGTPQIAGLGAAHGVEAGLFGEPEPASKPDVREKLDAIEQGAKTRLRKNAGKLNSGVDPADLRDYAIIGAVKLARGALSLADFSKQMIGEFGQGIAPHIEQIYQAARDHYHAEIAPKYGLARLDKPDPVLNGDVAARADVPPLRGDPEPDTGTRPDTGAARGLPPTNDVPVSSSDVSSTASSPKPSEPSEPSEPSASSDKSSVSSVSADKSASSEIASAVPDNSLTGTKNAITEQERAARGADPVERQLYTGMGQAYADGKAAVENGLADPAALAQEIANTPRPLTATEVGALAYDRYRLQKMYNGQAAALDKAIVQGDPSATATLREQLKQTEAALDVNDQALVKGGREQSAAFAARKIVVKDDGSLADVLTRAKRQKGADLTDAERARYQDLVDKYNAAQAQVEALTKAATKPGTGKSGATGDKTAVREAVNPGTRQYGKTNKLFTADKAEQARQNIADKLSKVGVQADPTGAQSFAHLASLLPDLVELGGYHLEAGLREFGAWAKQMRADVSDKLSDGDLQTIWTNARSEMMGRAERVPHPASGLFVDQLAKRLGRDGATAFVNSLADEDTGGPLILNKLLSGDPLTKDEQARVNQAYVDNTPGRAKPTAPSGALKTVADLVADTRQAAADAARANRSPDELLTESLTRRLGVDGARAFRDRIAPGGDRTLLDALLAGKDLTDAQQKTVAQAYLDSAPKRAAGAEPTGAVKTISELADSARAEQVQAAKDAAKANQPAPTVAQQFERRLVQALGRDGATTFLQKVNAATRNALMNGTLTDAQKIVVSDLYESLRRPSAQAGELDRASSALQGAVGESRKAQADAARANKPPLSDAEQFEQRVKAGLGTDGAARFFKAVDPEIVQAMIAGKELTPEQTKAVGEAYTSAQKPATSRLQLSAAAQVLGKAVSDTREQARLSGQINDLQTQLQNGSSSSSVPASSPSSSSASGSPVAEISKQIQSLRDQRDALRAAVADPRKVAAVQAKIADLQAQLKSGDYSKFQATQDANKAARAAGLAGQSGDLQKALTERDFVAARIRAAIQAQAPKTPLSKIVEATRTFKLTGTSVLAKLMGATAAHVPVEFVADALGAVAGQMTVKGQKLASVAGREGQFSVKGEIAQVRGMLSRQAVANAKQTILTGMNELDVLAGKTEHAGQPLNLKKGQSWLDLPGRIHGAEKSFLQTGAYAKSLQIRMDRARAQGLDVSDPEVQVRIGMGAALDAQNAKLQGDNKAAKVINDLIGQVERSPDKKVQVAGAILRTLFPVIKLPFNYLGKAIDMTGAGLVRGAAMHLKAIRGGEALTPEAADNIIRAYKYGGVGLICAYVGLTQPSWLQTGGFYAPGAKPRLDKDGRPMEAGTLEVAGHVVPHVLAHSPAAEAAQFWSSVGRGLQQAKETDWQGKAGEALRQSVGGLGHEAPGLESTMEAGKILGGERDAGKALGVYARNQIVPQIVQQAARGLDKGPDGQSVPRQTRGFREGFEEGVPVARNFLPAKTPKTTGGGRGSGRPSADPMAGYNRLLRNATRLPR